MKASVHECPFRKRKATKAIILILLKTSIKKYSCIDCTNFGGKEFVPIPNAGHCPHDEYPEVVNPAILEWLAV